MSGWGALVWGTLRHRFAGLVGIALFIPAAQAVLYIGLDPHGAASVAAGIAAAWVTATLAALWAGEELLSDEWDDGAIELYALSDHCDRFYWTWVGLVALVTAALTGVAWSAAALLFGVDLVGRVTAIAMHAALFAGALAPLVVLLRQIGRGAGAGGLLAPLLTLPLAAPVVLAVVQSSAVLVAQNQPSAKWMLLAAFFGILYLMLGAWVVPALIRE